MRPRVEAGRLSPHEILRSPSPRMTPSETRHPKNRGARLLTRILGLLTAAARALSRRLPAPARASRRDAPAGLRRSAGLRRPRAACRMAGGTVAASNGPSIVSRCHWKMSLRSWCASTRSRASALAQKPASTGLRENRLRGWPISAGCCAPVGENERLRDEVEVGEPAARELQVPRVVIALLPWR